MMAHVRWLLSHLGVLLMRVLAWLPLPVLRAMGFCLGRLLLVMLAGRRRVAAINLAIAFPTLDQPALAALLRAHFVAFAQAWLDRAWLWHGPAWLTRKRLHISGSTDAVMCSGPVVLFVPHFIGLDAAGIAVTQQLHRPLTNIYTNQANPVIDAWVLKRRQRFGNIVMFQRSAGVKAIVQDLKAGGMLALLPDMGFGPEHSIFVPFFGVVTTTIPSLSRFSRLAKARVIPLVTTMTRTGYEIEFKPVWDNFPTDDVYQDTLRMNQELEGYIAQHPSQYFWVHKRYKHRPPGASSIY